MVMTTENQTVISTQESELYNAKPSFKRWLKHSVYFRSSRRFFNTEQEQAITTAIDQAENGHRGEIQVIIEASLPSHFAYQYDTLERAQALFAKYRVWDTTHNSGLLIYLNLCAHKVEIVADRGINNAVEPECWQKICAQMTPYFKEKKIADGLCVGITALGDVLQDFYLDQPEDPEGNELPNTPRFL